MSENKNLNLIECNVVRKKNWANIFIGAWPVATVFKWRDGGFSAKDAEGEIDVYADNMDEAIEFVFTRMKTKFSDRHLPFEDKEQCAKTEKAFGYLKNEKRK